MMRDTNLEWIDRAIMWNQIGLSDEKVKEIFKTTGYWSEGINKKDGPIETTQYKEFKVAWKLITERDL
jgi:hypothetical protein